MIMTSIEMGSSGGVPPTVSRRMKNQPTSGTAPELLLRSELHRLGLRFRVQVPVIPNSRRLVDIAFGPAKVAVFVDGCFWHGCFEHRPLPKTSRDFWRKKIQANRQRDTETNSILMSLGWAPVRVWEHEDMKAAARTVAELVAKRRVH